MGTFVKDLVRIPKAGISDYADTARIVREHLMKVLNEKCQASLGVRDCKSIEAVSSTMYFEFPGMTNLTDRYEPAPELEEIFTAAFALHQAMGKRVLPKLWGEDIESRISNFFNADHPSQASLAAAHDLYQIWATCALNMGIEPMLYFYDKADSPFALLYWRSLPAPVAESLYTKFPEFGFSTTSGVAVEDLPLNAQAELKSLSEELGKGIAMSSEDSAKFKNWAETSIGTALAELRFEVWKELTGELPDPELGGLQFPVLDIQDKVQVFKRVLAEYLHPADTKKGGKQE